MNSRTRFLAACRRQPVDRAPAWMMRQAGRYLADYQAVRKNHTFLEMVHDPALSAEVTCQPIRHFGMDAAVVFCDILVPAEAMGVTVDFVEGRGPVLSPPVRTDADIDALEVFDAKEKTGFLAETLRLVRKEIGDERGLIGFCGAPFTVASYLVEGGTSRNYEHTKALMLDNPDGFDRLMSKIVDVSIPYLSMQLEAGADVVQIFDSWGGAFSAATYRRAILPHLTRLVTTVKKEGAPVIVYANGCGHLLEDLASSGADVLGIDWRVDPADAIRRVGDRVALQGNLDPTTLFASPDVVRREARAVLDAFANQNGYIFNLGSGILPKTPIESVAALWDTVLDPQGATSK